MGCVVRSLQFNAGCAVRSLQFNAASCAVRSLQFNAGCVVRSLQLALQVVAYNTRSCIVVHMAVYYTLYYTYVLYRRSIHTVL